MKRSLQILTILRLHLRVVSHYKDLVNTFKRSLSHLLESLTEDAETGYGK